ncbi:MULTISPECIES: DUF4334 domain-containing protein [unclassified Nocardia]|uniref:DUF4334 domain-containing protein n=1 Tax=unclassified Nocardia TaxID=2637762 RepID=UPI001CE4AD64|nr:MULTISPECIES: DUF4334 domain-containing protein [unclassified Nocardia]
MDGKSAADELRALQAEGCTAEAAQALFDRLPAALVTEVTSGRWQGEEFDTGHPFAGALAASGWYGKQFDGPEDVHPLLFADETGAIFAVDPRRVPMRLAGVLPRSGMRLVRRSLRYLAPALRTTTPKARLRDIEYRGTVSAAMIYDHLPVIDHFRKVDPDTLLGIMDMRGMREPYFFVLRREI